MTAEKEAPIMLHPSSNDITSSEVSTAPEIQEPSENTPPTTAGQDQPVKKKIRIRKACDSCNAKRTKCDGNKPCSHCSHVKIECTYLREEKRRGRASARYPKHVKKRKPSSLQSLIPLIENSKTTQIDNSQKPIPILPKRTSEFSLKEPLSTSNIPSNANLTNPSEGFQMGETKFPVLKASYIELKKIGIPYSVADELLQYYFESEIPPASRVFSIIRRIPMLESKRPTKSVLLLAIMLASAVQMDHAFFVGSNRDYACQSLYKAIQELLPQDQTSFELDDFLTTVHLGFLMPWLSYPSDSVHWWKLGYEVAHILKLNDVDPRMPGNIIEERLRGWWGLYILDRFTALCFNVPILITDVECLNVYLPYDEFIWNTTVQEVMAPNLDMNRTKFIDSSQVGYDFYGWIIPICSIMGKFIQYKKAVDIDIKHLLKSELIKSEFSNLEALNKFQNMIQTIGAPAGKEEKLATLDVLHAKYVNNTMSFITLNIEDSETLGDFKNEASDVQLLKLEQCIEILEEIIKIDESVHKYPFILSFFLFVSGVSFLSVLNNFNSGDRTDVTKINRIKYFVKVLVRAMEGVLSIIPCEFLRTIRNQLILSIKDCENLILLTDYIDRFKENARKRREIFRAYSWDTNGRGIAV